MGEILVQHYETRYNGHSRSNLSMPEDRPATADDVKRFLLGCRRIDMRVNITSQDQMRWRYLQQRLTASYGGSGSGGGGVPGSQVESTVTKIIDIEERLRRNADNLADRKNFAMLLSELLEDDRHVAIMTMRYFLAMSWPKITEEMHYERAQTFRLHRQMLEAAAEKLNDTNGTSNLRVAMYAMTDRRQPRNLQRRRGKGD